MTVASVRDVFVAYPSPAGTVMALRGLTLTVDRGERLLIQGPNGSGKSTLLRLLTGEQAVTAGTVRVGATELSRLSHSQRRRWRSRGIGMVDQHARRALLPEWRVADNIGLQLRLAGSSHRDACRQAAATLDMLGLAALGDRSVATLSGGEAQRVAICAALAHGPELILADEPTGELDEAAAHQVYRLLTDASRTLGAALVLVSHDPRAGQAADRAVRLRDGRLAEEWRPGGPAGEFQVLDERGWLRLPARLLPRRDRPLAVRAEALTAGRISLDLPLAAASPAGPAGALPDFPVPGQVAVLPGAPEAADGRTLPLVFDRVSVRFGDRTVLTDFDLVLRRGELAALAGPSGSGKSTILSLAAGLSDPSAGLVSVAGTRWQPLHRGDRAELRRRHVAVALQNTILAEALTVAENLRFAAALRSGGAPAGHRIDARAVDARAVDVRAVDARAGDVPPVNLRAAGAREVDVAGIAAELGLSPLLDQPVRLLSGGERQRVAVAKCLASGAALMLLDEPTSQQDEASARLVVAAVQHRVESGTAVLAASHDPVFLAAAVRIIRVGRS